MSGYACKVKFVNFIRRVNYSYETLLTIMKFGKKSQLVVPTNEGKNSKNRNLSLQID